MGQYKRACAWFPEVDSSRGQSRASGVEWWLRRAWAACSVICAASMWAFDPGDALAGRHAGGTLILHAEPSIVFTDGESFCGAVDLPVCSEARTSVPADPTQTIVFSCFAAFPAQADPLLVGVTFGVRYAADDFTLVGLGGCGDLETPEEDWPASDSGTAIAWAMARTEHLVEVYWFAGYVNESDQPAVFLLRTHPLQGGGFVEDGPVGDIDEIADYGELGFGTSGYLPCPDGPVPTVKSSWGEVKSSFR